MSVRSISLGSIAVVAAASFAPSSNAAVFTVGTGTGCSHSTIQAAIDAAEGNPGPDTVRISNSQSYDPQHVSIDTSQMLEVEGGYAQCGSGSGGGNTVIDGGNVPASVFSIRIGTGGRVLLRGLTIRGANWGVVLIEDPGSGDLIPYFTHGSGVRFSGDGILEIRDSSIILNRSLSGGGILAVGTGTNAELVIGSNVVIASNTAHEFPGYFSGIGGGVHVVGVEMSMLEPGSVILFNSANYGGGLAVSASEFSSYAYIGGGGIGSSGAIHGNTARYGGGVAVVGFEPPGSTPRKSELHLFTVDPQPRSAVRDNYATVAGGGIYVRSYGPDFTGDAVYSTAKVWNADLIDNEAPAGAAVYVAEPLGSSSFSPDIGNGLEFNLAPWRPGAAACVAGAACGRIVGNLARNSEGQPSGAIIQLEHDYSYARIGDTLPRGGVVFRENAGQRLVDGAGGDHTTLRLTNAELSGNALSQQLVRMGDGGALALSDVTVADNEIGAGQILQVGSDADVVLRRSIFWKPGKVTLSRGGGGSLSVTSVIASEAASLGGAPEATVVASPRFVDFDRGDFRLRAASPAVDAALAVAGDDRDAEGRPRDVDLPIKANVRGPRDIGAHERQAVPPLVLNGGYDVDLNLWSGPNTTWDASNLVGASASGSARVSLSGAPGPVLADGASQCIHLPGPGRYLLNGWARVAGTNPMLLDDAYLRWELRHDGGEGCSFGAPDASGEHFLGSSGSFVRPAQAAEIVLPAQAWTGNSSILVRLHVKDGGISQPISMTAFFDGISLVPDAVFSGGFEP